MKSNFYKTIAKNLEEVSSLYPNKVVKYYHRQTIEGRYCMLMEWYEHFSVRKHRQDSWNIKTKLRISSEILDALSALHQGHITHRDIKPDNIFLTFNDEVRIGGLDFLEYPSKMCDRRTVGGTPEYISPFLKKLWDQNIKSSSRIDPYKEDVWSTGITLYEIFTLEGRESLLGEYNYSKKTATQKENEVKERIRIRMHGLGLQDKVIEIILDMLTFDEENRINMSEADFRFKNLLSINKQEKIFLGDYELLRR